MSRLPSLAVILLLAVNQAWAAAPPVVVYEKWTPEDVVHQESADGLHFSPDGKHVVWVRHSPDKEKNEHVGHLFRTDLTTGKQVQLTRGKEACLSPRYSPDGAHLAFLSERAAPKEKSEDKSGKRRKKEDDEETKAQIWLLDPTGGEPWVLTESPRAISLYAWLDDDSLIYAAQEDAGRRETVLKDEKKDDSSVVEDDPHEPPVRLFRVEVKSKKVTRLSDNKDRIEKLAVSPDGKLAVALHARSLRYTYDNKTKPIVMLHDLTTKKSRQVFADPKLNVQAIHWAPDGKGFYLINDHNSKPQFAQAGVTEVHFHDLKTGKETKLDLAWPRGLALAGEGDDARGFVPLADGFVALLAEGVKIRAARYQWQNNKLARAWLGGEHAAQVTGLSSTADGKRIGYRHSTASQPAQWYHARLVGPKLVEPRPVGKLNETLDTRRRARVEVVEWKGARGDVVQGLLFYPHGYVKGTKAPLVVQIHGGPASADRDEWDETWAYAANLFCQRGAFVFKPNYHGSTGYGLAWLESITDGKYCDLEVEDVESGVDSLIAKGLIDEKRMGLQGWSNGAILTNVLIANTTRYKAASAGAGTVEYVSDWASCEFGDAFDRYYLGKSPLEDPSLYFRKSPVFRYDKVRTPTIIFFGTEDRVVHPQQGWMQYRALQQLGKVPVRFVQFPGAKHSLAKLSHRKRKLEEEMAWFDQHLFGNGKAKEVVLKEDSPLSWLLKKQQAKKAGDRYGEQVKGVLVPEAVKFSTFQVGRFEVTRAQYAAFDRNYRVAAGKENHPANDVTFEQAKAYCAWLSRTTGRTYRLPNESEAEELYDKSEAGENTLDAWAGYTVNLDDAAVLREKVKGLGAGALLREVGQGRGSGSGKAELVYDLGGNVAEWTQGKDGKGALKGGSADVPADARGGLEAMKEYRGFRVVREGK